MKKPRLKIHKAFFITAMALLLFIRVSAQSDFRNAYYVNNSGDTIYGQINYRGDISNASKCEFKHDASTNIQTFHPGEIKAYRFINGRYFISDTVTANNKTKVVFLEYLLDGVADLYYFRDISGDHYYIENKGDSLIELEAYQTKHIEGIGEVLKESDKYIGLLKLSFSDSPEVLRETETAKLTHKSLIELTKKYHDYTCEGEECIIYVNPRPDAEMRLGLTIGFNSSHFLWSDYYDDVYDFKSNKMQFLSPSIHFSSSLPKLNEKLFWDLEVNFSKNYYFSSLDIEEPSENTRYFDMHVHAKKIKASTGLTFAPGNDKFRARLGTGLRFDYFTSNGVKLIEEFENNYIVNSYSYQRQLPSGLYGGFYALAGLEYHINEKIGFISNIHYSKSKRSQISFYTTTFSIGTLITL
jgi:hypothetical protein